MTQSIGASEQLDIELLRKQLDDYLGEQIAHIKNAHNKATPPYPHPHELSYRLGLIVGIRLAIELIDMELK